MASALNPVTTCNVQISSINIEHLKPFSNDIIHVYARLCNVQKSSINIEHLSHLVTTLYMCMQDYVWYRNHQSL